MLKKRTTKKDSVLTPRQEQIFKCILKGMNNRQIAEELEITYFTAKLMSSMTLKKLNCASKNEAMAKFLKK